MATIKLTSKRQATFPKQLCEELGVRSGDRIEVVKRKLSGKFVWCIVRGEKAPPSWFGAANKYAAGKSHLMKDIRAAIAKDYKRG